MEKSLQTKLLLYLALSAVGFAYLAMPQNAGIGVTVFGLLQLGCLLCIAPDKKTLWWFAPAMVLFCNPFLSANRMWVAPNCIIILLIYSLVSLQIRREFRLGDNRFLGDLLENLFNPISYLPEPLRMVNTKDANRARIIKRALLGVVITVPCLIFLVLLLSSADSIFSHGVSDFLNSIFEMGNGNVLWKSLLGVVVGFYLFGFAYHLYQPVRERKNPVLPRRGGDLIVLNILLCSVLAVYTLFVIIQFRYLFAGAQLPYGLSYTDYARKGFFELLFLTAVNIGLILLTVALTKEKNGRWKSVTKALCSYLCAVTVILLASSFYRMWLYCSDDGLTRLRLLVFGFLIFESIGLLITFFYIAKPKFNIIAVYLVIALVYYLLLNVVPIDAVVAKSQVDRYYDHRGYGIAYVMTLSADAAPQIARLLDAPTYPAREQAEAWFARQKSYYADFVPRWQRFNLSVEVMKQID